VLFCYPQICPYCY